MTGSKAVSSYFLSPFGTLNSLERVPVEGFDRKANGAAVCCFSRKFERLTRQTFAQTSIQSSASKSFALHTEK